MFRHWRIQVSLICFALLLGVIVLWVQSYKWDRHRYWQDASHATSCVRLSYKCSYLLRVFSPYRHQSARWHFVKRSIDLNVMRNTVIRSEIVTVKSFLGFSDYEYRFLAATRRALLVYLDHLCSAVRIALVLATIQLQSPHFLYRFHGSRRGARIHRLAD